MPFTAPHNYLTFYKEIVEKSHKLIEIKYWDKIEHRTLNQWLKNFTTDEEKYLSALILHKLVYRNHQSIDSILNKLFNITIPNILEKNNIFMHSYNLDEWRDKLKSSTFKDETTFLFSTITSEELGDSGNDYMRRLREKFISKELIIRITSTPDKYYKALFFIDDIIATGEQVSEFLEENKDYLEKYSYLIFTPLIAHRKGIEKINRKIKKLDFTSTIILQPMEIINDDNFFIDFEIDSENKFDSENTLEELEEFYISTIEQYHLEEQTSNYFGFGSLGLTLIFATGIPDNTIPFIRNKGIQASWTPLYEKY